MFRPGAPLDLNLDPLEALARWPQDRPVVMLHSGRFEARWSRYTLLAEPVATLTHDQAGKRWLGEAPCDAAALTGDPFRDLDLAAAADDSFYVGYLSYDLARQVEHLPGGAGQAVNDRDWPLMLMHRCPNAMVFDHAERRWHAVGPAPDRLPRLDLSDASPGSFTASTPRPDRTRDEHEHAVQRVLDYITAGDVFQVNLAQRFTADFDGCPRSLYARLAEASPAWYGSYLEHFTDGRRTHALCSTSPELFLELDAFRHVTTRPIKGTRPAATDPNELRDSLKDTAELNMIIDLLRNDLGRVCDYGSVRVTQPRTIESHPTVHHGVATVEGRLHPSRSLRHLLRAAFPGGSVTGAPKVRAMQIIDELEPTRRGPYCGAIGWARQGEDGQTQTQLSIAIRTLLVDQARGRVDFSVGGGIVADSVPREEYEETLAKAAAMIAALRA